MSEVVVIGECMIELLDDGSVMRRSYAGDVYNTAVYLKYASPATPVSIMTGVGDDAFSQEMLDTFQRHRLGIERVAINPNRVPGIYAVQTDDAGERSFMYWRSESAARTLFEYLKPEQRSRCSDIGYCFISGISLAILEKESLEQCFAFLREARKQGAKVVFDPNYRARLWSSVDEARTVFNRMLEITDLFMPGLEELQTLWDANSMLEFLRHLDAKPVSEIVLKNGPEDVRYWQRGAELETVKITPADTVVDTTSAGDAFNGGFLAARVRGLSPVESIKAGAKISAEVIQHRGAIMPQHRLNALSGEVFAE